MSRLIYLISVLVLAGVNTVQAAENINYVIHQHYVAPRALGAGNSFTVIDDYNVLFYNPAGLARLQEGEINMAIQGAITPSALTFAKDLEDASKLSEAEKIPKVNQILTDNFGKSYATRAPGVQAIWARPKWGIGLVAVDPSVYLNINQTGGPQLGVMAINDTTLAFGMAKSYGEKDSLSVGGTVKAVYRGYVNKSFNAFDIATDPKFFKVEDAQEGLTVDLDLGSQYEVVIREEGPFKWLKYAKPTFGLVVRNVLDFGFKSNMHLYDKKTTDNPAKLGRRLDIGSKYELPSFWVFQPRFMFDVRDIGHRYFTFLKGLHTGFELKWKAFDWLKGGYSVGLGQGYISAGIEAQLAWFNLSAATYGEEIGSSTTKKENRYYIARLSLDF